jgi:WD40 repeat protein
LATASLDKTVKLWDAVTGQEIRTFTGHTGGVFSVAFSPYTVKLRDAETGRELRTLAGHRAPVHQVAFSPDGRRLASIGGDETAVVWDLETGQALQTLKDIGGFDIGVAFSPEGKWLITSGAPPKLWDADTGQEIRSFIGHRSWCVAMPPWC